VQTIGSLQLLHWYCLTIQDEYGWSMLLDQERNLDYSLIMTLIQQTIITHSFANYYQTGNLHLIIRSRACSTEYNISWSLLNFAGIFGNVLLLDYAFRMDWQCSLDCYYLWTNVWLGTAHLLRHNLVFTHSGMEIPCDTACTPWTCCMASTELSFEGRAMSWRDSLNQVWKTQRKTRRIKRTINCKHK